MFSVQPFEAKELGNASFLVADPDAKVAAVIDPSRRASSAQQEPSYQLTW